jgi:hypothetical protein
MEVASRPYAAGGIALVAASVIAVSPIAPPLPDIHVPNPAQVARSVELAAATTSITLGQVLQQAVTNAQALLTAFRENPAPILSQIAHNQATTLQNLMAGLQTTGGAISTALKTTVPPLLQAAFKDIEGGNVEGAIDNVLNATLATAFPITELIPTLSAAVTQPMTDLVNAINAVQVGGVLSPLSLAVTGLLGPVLSGAGAFGVAVDNVGNAIGTGNPQAVLNAVVNGPAVILDGVLNGGYGPNLAALAGLPPDLITVLAGGLLSGPLHGSPTGALVLSGTIDSLQELAKAFAAALAPPKVMAALKSSTLAAPAALPAAASKTVTLTTGSTAAIPAKASTPDAPATDGAATDASTQKPEDAADGTDPTKDTADTTKDSSSTSASTPASSSDAAESGSTTKDSTPNASSTDDTDVKKPTDTSTGNKSEPGNTAGSDASKSGDASNSTASHEASSGHTGTTKSTSDSATKGASKGAHTTHGRHAK